MLAKNDNVQMSSSTSSKLLPCTADYRTGKRKSLSQFSDVNEVVQQSLDNEGGSRFSQTVNERVTLMGRFNGMLKQLTSLSSPSNDRSVSLVDSRSPTHAFSAVRALSDDSALKGGPSVIQSSNTLVTSYVSLEPLNSNTSTDVPSPLIKNSEISAPSTVRHDVQVVYDAYHARYVGLPSDWLSMNRVFGMPYDTLPKVRLEQYSSRIPAVLEMLKRNFLERNGQEVVGIFRLSAMKEEVDAAKNAINSGNFDESSCKDVHIIANLIKVLSLSLLFGLDLNVLTVDFFS
jgi:hypothetical protein